MSTSLPVDREEGRRLAREELADPAYANEEALVVRLWNAFVEWLEELVSGVGGAVPGGWVLGAVLVAVLLLAVVAILLASPARRARRPEPLLDASTPMTARDHRTRADEEAAAGRYATAVRERLRAITRDLEEHAVLSPRPGRTAGELANEVAAAAPEHGERIRAAARIFNDVWYGQREATAEHYRLLTSTDEALATLEKAT